MFREAQSAKKKKFFYAAILDHFNKNIQFGDHFFRALFPKDSESLKILDIRHQEVGGKIGLKI